MVVLLSGSWFPPASSIAGLPTVSLKVAELEPPAGCRYRISPKKWGIFHPENVILVHNPAGGFANSDFKNAVALEQGE
jgi:hypothetical protein